jgi:hypothetical protein
MLLNESVARADPERTKPVAEDLRALEACPLTQAARPAAQLVRARLAGLEGRDDQAKQLLREAAEGLEAVGLRPDAALARYALGKRMADEEGRQLCALAERQLAEHGVSDLSALLVRRFPELMTQSETG